MRIVNWAILAFFIFISCSSSKKTKEPFQENNTLKVDTLANKKDFEKLAEFRMKEITETITNVDNAITAINESIRKKRILMDSLYKFLSDSLKAMKNDTVSENLTNAYYHLVFLWNKSNEQVMILQEYIYYKKRLMEDLSEIILMEFSEENYRKLVKYDVGK